MSPAEPQASGTGMELGSLAVPLKPLGKYLLSLHSILTLKLRNCLVVAWVLCHATLFLSTATTWMLSARLPPTAKPPLQSGTISHKEHCSSLASVTGVTFPLEHRQPKYVCPCRNGEKNTCMSPKLICLSIRDLKEGYLTSLTVTRLQL